MFVGTISFDIHMNHTVFRLSTLKKNKIKLTSGKKSSVLAFPQNESPDSREGQRQTLPLTPPWMDGDCEPNPTPKTPKALLAPLQLFLCLSLNLFCLKMGG